VKLHGLATWWDMLEAAKATGLLNAADAAEVKSFLDSPESWSAAHGGKVGAQA
jgi:orotate phosphoribosyltransferase